MAKRSYIEKVQSARLSRRTSKSAKVTEENEETKCYDRGSKFGAEVDETRIAFEILHKPKHSYECAPEPTEPQVNDTSTSSMVLAQLQELENKLGQFQLKLQANETELNLRSVENNELRQMVSRLQHEVIDLGGSALLDTIQLERKTKCTSCIEVCVLF